MKRWQETFLGFLLGLSLSGVIILITSPKRGKPIDLREPPTPSPITIDVAGAVRNPGVYHLPPGSRWIDAVNLAGGSLSDADLSLVNLAAELVDGQRLWIPQKVDRTQQAADNATQAALKTTATPVPLSSDNPLNINTATEEELELLPGIGPVRASAITAYRQQNGPFTTIEEIQNVPGISASVFEGIKGLIIIVPTQ